jgi:hypothetical protein
MVFLPVGVLAFAKYCFSGDAKVKVSNETVEKVQFPHFSPIGI